MAECKDCINNDACKEVGMSFKHKAFGAEACCLFKSTSDVVPRAEVERLEYENKLILDEGQAWHRTAELNAQRIIELEAEKDALIKNYAECMRDYAREMLEDMRIPISVRVKTLDKLLSDTIEPTAVRIYNTEQATLIDVLKIIERLKKKYTEDRGDG